MVINYYFNNSQLCSFESLQKPKILLYLPSYETQKLITTATTFIAMCSASTMNVSVNLYKYVGSNH